MARLVVGIAAASTASLETPNEIVSSMSGGAAVLARYRSDGTNTQKDEQWRRTRVNATLLEGTVVRWRHPLAGKVPRGCLAAPDRASTFPNCGRLNVYLANRGEGPP